MAADMGLPFLRHDALGVWRAYGPRLSTVMDMVGTENTRTTKYTQTTPYPLRAHPRRIRSAEWPSRTARDTVITTTGGSTGFARRVAATSSAPTRRASPHRKRRILR